MLEIHDITVFSDGSIDGLFSVRQFDNLSHTLAFDLQSTIASGDAAQLRVQPAGKNEPYLYPCTMSGNRVTVTPNNSAWQAPGFASCQLEITSAGEVIWQTNVFPIKVIRSLDETGGMTPEEGQTLVDQLEAARDEALTAASAANEAAEKAQIVKILGTYATLDDLEQAVENPSQGDHYNVGTAAPYTVYMWDATTPPGEWINQGQMEGPQGETGPQGPEGPQGEAGPTGPQGEKGDPGPTGPQGPTGETGPTGPQGEPGAVFTPAVTAEGVLSWTNTGSLANPDPVNIKGPQGEQGETGPIGPQGIEGPQGPKGDTGTGLDIKGTYDNLEALQAAITQPAQGDMYNVGTADPYTVYMWDTTTEPGQWLSQGQLQGAQGPEGPEGPQGPKGPQGEQGIQGEQGPQGDPGPKGDTGPQGPAGPYFIPAVSQDGDLSWTNTGSLDNPTTVNIKGPQGEQGIQGPIGPEGPQGPEGPAGANGADGAQGPAGPNEVTTSTTTDITGILKGTGAAIAQAVSGTDYAPPSQSITATLTAAGWADNAQTLTVSGVTATSNGLLRIAQSATTEQFTAWGAALSRITAQAAGSITVTIAGTVPTVDIPVEVIII